MSTEVVTRPSIPAELQEKVLLSGDLSKLTASERLSYYNAVCTSVGLNPLTRPLEYLYLNGKMVLYARKDCTDQLRELRGVSVEITSRAVMEDVFVVTAQAKDMTERKDESIGAVPLPQSPIDKANAMMKAETKAKRRVTLSICGLGILDETEIDTIPGAKVVTNGPPLPTGAEMLAKMEAKGSVHEPEVEEVMEEIEQAEAPFLHPAMNMPPITSILRDVDNAPDDAAKIRIINEALAMPYPQHDKALLIKKVKGVKK